ncbi:MAG TPA: hypothetical protein VHJ82_09005, partial [Actinomycetota bacterium]|nr:hypothetical protein [Actinomycetota bacterium]
ERVAEKLAAAFPRADVRYVARETLARLSQGPPPDIYVTTWIGTKEILRPEVSLVGIINADVLIRRPDWRAAEDAYHALAEMSEWAGSAENGGRLVIQTSDPRHHAVQAIARADFHYFLEREIEHRRELNYPPHKELIRVTARGPQARTLIEKIGAASRVHGAIALGPIPARRGGPGDRVSDGGLEMLLKCDDAGAVAEGLRDILAGVRGGDSVSVDVDPV